MTDVDCPVIHQSLYIKWFQFFLEDKSVSVYFQSVAVFNVKPVQE